MDYLNSIVRVISADAWISSIHCHSTGNPVDLSLFCDYVDSIVRVVSADAGRPHPWPYDWSPSCFTFVSFSDMRQLPFSSLAFSVLRFLCGFLSPSLIASFLRQFLSPSHSSSVASLLRHFFLPSLASFLRHFLPPLISVLSVFNVDLLNNTGRTPAGGPSPRRPRVRTPRERRGGRRRGCRGSPEAPSVTPFLPPPLSPSPSSPPLPSPPPTPPSPHSLSSLLQRRRWWLDVVRGRRCQRGLHDRWQSLKMAVLI